MRASPAPLRLGSRWVNISVLSLRSRWTQDKIKGPWTDYPNGKYIFCARYWTYLHMLPRVHSSAFLLIKENKVSLRGLQITSRPDKTKKGFNPTSWFLPLMLQALGPFQTPPHSCAEPNWWVKYGRRAVFESVWFGRLGLVRQTILNSAGSVELCDVGAAADSYGVLLMGRT